MTVLSGVRRRRIPLRSFSVAAGKKERPATRNGAGDQNGELAAPGALMDLPRAGHPVSAWSAAARRMSNT